MIARLLLRRVKPAARRKLASVILDLSVVGWAATHALMIATDPPENSWVFHVLLAISWFAITATALDVLLTSDVRTEQEGE